MALPKHTKKYISFCMFTYEKNSIYQKFRLLLLKKDFFQIQKLLKTFQKCEYCEAFNYLETIKNVHLKAVSYVDELPVESNVQHKFDPFCALHTGTCCHGGRKFMWCLKLIKFMLHKGCHQGFDFRV